MIKSFLIILVMIGVKAIFSASDTAFTYINKSKISQESKKNKKAAKIKKMINNNSKFLGVIEVGITFIELLASAYASEAFVNPLVSVITDYTKLPKQSAIIIAIIIVALILSYFLLVFGGLMPKRIARNHPEKTAYRLINILSIISLVNIPFEKLVHFSTNLFCKIFGIESQDKQNLSEKEIKMMIQEGVDEGVINKLNKNIFMNSFKFTDTKVKKIMTPFEKVEMINSKDDIKAVLSKIKKSKYTRFPVFENSKSNIIGILNIKNILINAEENIEQDINVKQIMHQVFFVDSEESISIVLKTMQLNKFALMVVTNPDKQILGIVTMEDILEELVGEIIDEYDK